MNEPSTRSPRAANIVAARGSSMFPLIKDGARVGIAPVSASDLVCGEIIAFHSGQDTILHRVIAKRESNGALRIREKGDNTRFSTWIEAERCVGKAIWVADRGVTRQLDVAPSSLRVRLLTLGSRCEANVFEALSRVARAIWPAQRPAAVLALGRWAALALWPLKMLVGPALFSVYRRRPEAPDADLARCTLAYFRAIAGNTPMEQSNLSDTVGWRLLLNSICWHGLDPLAAKSLGGLGVDLPAEMVNELQFLRYRGAFSHVAGRTTLKEVADALEADKIPYAVLKGAPLAHALYGDRTLRPFSDLDVLVRREDRDAALAALNKAGYVTHGAVLQQALVKRGHFHVVLTAGAKGRLTVELHWALVDRANLYRLDHDELFSRLRRIAADETAASVLALEDELIYLCLHAAKHGLFNAWALRRGEPAEWFVRALTGNRLIWFMDLKRFLEKHAGYLDWTAIRERMARWNVEEDVIRCLTILDLLLPDAEAASALARLGAPANAAARGARRQRRPSARSTRILERMMKADAGLVIRPARLLTIGAWLFPSPRQLLRFYSCDQRWALPFLYVVHPFRMMYRLFFE